MKRRYDEAEETASFSEENICSSRVIVGSKHYFLQFVVHALGLYRAFWEGKCGQLNRIVELSTVTVTGWHSGRGECGR